MTQIEVLREMINRLEANGIEFALGGSGLLFFLGLQKEVGDWDIMTDAPAESVEECLLGLTYSRVGPKPPFVSQFLFQIELHGYKVEIIGGFKLEISGQFFEIPATKEIVIDGVPLASVESWIKIYELLGRNEKATALRSWSHLV